MCPAALLPADHCTSAAPTKMRFTCSKSLLLDVAELAKLTAKEGKRDPNEGREDHKQGAHKHPGEQLALDVLAPAQVLCHVKDWHGVHLQQHTLALSHLTSATCQRQKHKLA